MKKAVKVIAILLAIGAAVAAVLLYLKKMGYFDDCDMDCENCENNCTEEDSFDEREYVSLQPRKSEDAAEESEASAEESEDAAEESEELPVEESKDAE